MRETITMTTVDHRRAWVLTRVMAGELGVAEAAGLLGLSARSVWRLKRRFGEEGPAGLVHGNRGRASSRRILALLEEAIELCGVPHELMTDNGTPFVAIVRTMLSRFQRSLADLRIRHIRTQIDTPWTNGKIEAFWATLQAEVLDRQQLADLAAAEAAVTAYAGYYNYHRLHGELDWNMPAERFDGTPLTDRGFASVPALANVADLLNAILAAQRQSHLHRGTSLREAG